MNKFFEILMPILTNDKKILDESVSSVIENVDYINKAIFVVEKNSESAFRQVLEKLDKEKKLNHEIIVCENNTNKISKLRSTLDSISADKFVIVLDEDDQLLNLENISKKIDTNADVILTPYMFEMKGKICIKKFNKDKKDWEGNDEFPYYNNHNIFASSKIFKEAFEKMILFDFQKHEDVYRGISYMTLANSFQEFDDSKYCVIKYRIIEGRKHASMTFKKEDVSNWMLALLKNLYLSNFKFSNFEKLRFSQLNALIRIYRTIFIQLHLKSMENSKEIEFIQKILVDNGEEITMDGLFNNEYMINIFNDIVNNEKVKSH